MTKVFTNFKKYYGVSQKRTWYIQEPCIYAIYVVHKKLERDD